MIDFIISINYKNFLFSCLKESNCWKNNIKSVIRTLLVSHDDNQVINNAIKLHISDNCDDNGDNNGDANQHASTIGQETNIFLKKNSNTLDKNTSVSHASTLPQSQSNDEHLIDTSLKSQQEGCKDSCPKIPASRPRGRPRKYPLVIESDVEKKLSPISPVVTSPNIYNPNSDALKTPTTRKSFVARQQMDYNHGLINAYKAFPYLVGTC